MLAAQGCAFVPMMWSSPAHTAHPNALNEARKHLDLESQYRIQQLERLRHQRKEAMETHSVHLELMDLMKQCIVYSSNIAKTFLATCGQKHPVDFSRFEN